MQFERKQVTRNVLALGGLLVGVLAAAYLFAASGVAKSASLLGASEQFTVGEREFFLFKDDLKNWYEARDTCQQLGYELAPTDTEETRAALQQRSAGMYVWIGLKLDTSADEWTFTDSRPVPADFQWAPDDPNAAVTDEGEFCVMKSTAADPNYEGKFIDTPNCASDLHAFVCEDLTTDVVATTTRRPVETAAATPGTDTAIVVHLSEAMTYSEANEFCAEEYNTHLAVIEHWTANQRYWDLLEIYDVSAWIGFADLQNADDFQWLDASEGLYANWDEGEPTDLCVQMLAATGTWKDVHCSEALPTFFCEAPPTFWATTVVRVDGAEVHSLPTAVTSEAAQAYCQSRAEDLYSVIDEADNERIVTALKAASVDFAFVGMYADVASYRWADGREINWAAASDRWADGEPKENHFSQLRASDGQWMTACVDEAVVGVVCAVTATEFTCDDGCVIDVKYVDDNMCDCAQCEDEPKWSCETCGGCPSVCVDSLVKKQRLDADLHCHPMHTSYAPA